MPDPKDFGASFLKFMKTMNAAAPEESEDFFGARLREHFGAAADSLPVVSHAFQLYQRPDVQRALDAMLADESRAQRPWEIIGIANQPPDLASMASGCNADYQRISPGPVQYVTFDLSDGGSISCIDCGLVLVRPGGTPLAILVNGPSGHGFNQGVTVEVMAPHREVAEKFIAEWRTRAITRRTTAPAPRSPAAGPGKWP